MPSASHIRKLLALVLGAGLVVGLVLLRGPAAERVVALAGWVDGLGWVAPVAFTSIYAAAIPLLVPAGPFLLIAGILFGPFLGALYGLLGTVVGGAAAFALGRHLVRDWVAGRLESATGFSLFQEALRREGLRGAVLIRLSPVLPAWLINYALGVSPLGWRPYLLSSVSAVPTVLLYSLSGSGLGDLAALERGEEPQRGTLHYAFLAAGIAATLAVSVLLGRRARRILETIEDG